MRTRFTGVAVAVAVFLGSAGTAGANAEARPQPAYTVIEVARFDVDREDYSTKEAQRAGSIPDEMLDQIQRALIGELTRSDLGLKVRKPNEAAEEGEVIISLGGKIADYKPGNRAARIHIGFGAGAQHIEADVTLTDRASGRLVGQKRIIDRKFGGLTGGSEEKGLRDFGEKVVELIKTVLPQRSE